MIKRFKKAISIIITAMFVLSLLPSSAFAALTYGNSKPAGYPWHGSNVPEVVMTNSDGSFNVITPNGDKGYTAADLTKATALESVNGNYGKKSDDFVYETYDLATRTSFTSEQGCFKFGSIKNKDAVLEFTFAYETSGNKLPNSNTTIGLLMQSSPRLYTTFDCTNKAYADISEMLGVKDDKINFTTDKTKTEITELNNNGASYNFEPGKWYTVNLVFDFENKAANADANLQSTYKYYTYVNGALVSTHETTEAYYGFRWFRLFPAPESTMYWDNMICYAIEDANTYTPQAAATLSSANENIVVNGNNIKLNSLATANDVKEAVSASLKENETVRIYNSDYTAEIASDGLALDAKLVVAGNKVLTNETTPRENIYTYYDVKLDGYLFSEPTINIDDTGLSATGSVKLYNYSGERQEFKSYLAVYNGSELENVTVAGNNIVAEENETEVEYTTSVADLSNGNKVKFFIWNNDGISPEIRCVEKSYTIADEYNPKNADLESVTLPMIAYNANHNQIATLYPAFDKDITEYTVYAYTKDYSGSELTLNTANSNASVSLTTAPDTSASKAKAVYTVTSADGSVTKDYTFNYIAGNDGSKRNPITNAVNIYIKTSRECLASWNSQSTQFASGSNIYLQDGIFVKSSTDLRTIKTTNAIIEVDISAVPEDIDYGILRLSLTNTFNQAKKSGTVRINKVNNAVYTDGLAAITTSNIATYIGDELAVITVNPIAGNNADMYLVNIGDDYIEELKAAGKTKMYVSITGVTNDPEGGFSAIFSGKTADSSRYSESLMDYVAAE